jgi:ABC-type nitrate/sulfonate/bicarbonate transport system permease component
VSTLVRNRDSVPTAIGPPPKRSTNRYRKSRSVGAKVLAAVGIVVLWQLGSTVGAIDSATVASPIQIGAELRSSAGDGVFWAALGSTLQGWALGLALSVVLALPIGLALGSSALAYRSCRFTIDFLRTIPPVALVPLALLLYGATMQMKVVLVVLGASWPLLLQTMSGVQQVDPVARETARSFRLDRTRSLIWLVIPEAAPFIATGLRIAATMALILTVGSELIGSAPGLGQQIGFAETGTDIPRLYALIVVAATLGVIVNASLAHLERRALSWHVSQRVLS